MKAYFTAIYNQLKERSVEATVSVLGIKSKPLRDFVKLQLSEDRSGISNMIADPVFESVFPWMPCNLSLKDLSPDLLNPKLIEALENPRIFSNQKFPSTTHPYEHQLKSWRILLEEKPKSLIVTSGTGSGKTECFMIPILNDLVNQYSKKKERVEGVQALFIYPLNALINSQRERLAAWTSRFGSDVRFCLYKGDTPEKITSAEQAKSPCEVMSRDQLRQSPPPILITNSTMLEYMLIRNVDRPILDKSQGKLRWIVLDEAHSYIGSQAAELSLLLRRALHAFGIDDPNQVRFIATSATIGSDEDSKQILKRYLADLAGIDEGNIEVINGRRSIPELPNDRERKNFQPMDISNLPGLEQYNALSSNPLSIGLRRELLRRPRTLSELSKSVFDSDQSKGSKMDVLNWLDACSNPEVKDVNDKTFLPLRGHMFHRVINGLWACVDHNCTAKYNTPLSNPTWQFGKVYTYQRVKCECGAPIFELVICNECSAAHLSAFRVGDHIIQSPKESIDEFSLENENSDDDDDMEEYQSSGEIVICPSDDNGALTMTLDRDGTLSGIGGNGIRIYYQQDLKCSVCDFSGFGKKAPFRHAYLGAPFYSSTIVPTLLEFCPNSQTEQMSRPMFGRTLITFTDSRQGTARIAAKMQQDSERSRTRGLVFHIVSKKENSKKIEDLNEVITALEAGSSKPKPILDLIEAKKIEMERLRTPWTTWRELANEMQNDDDVRVHMLDYYKSINSELFSTPENLIQILLIREFSRRPKRANSLETLGLIATDYQNLYEIRTVPVEWNRKGLSLKDWLDFLKISLDFFVRDGVFININPSWLNWLGGRYTPKSLLPPNTPSNQADARNRIWPSYDKKRGKRQHRLIRILAHAISIPLDATTREEIDALNDLMNSAWIALTQTSQILQAEGGVIARFRLNVEKISFKPISQGWHCPITLRVLDTTLCNYTPYLPIGAAPGEYQCNRVNFPTYFRPVTQTHEKRLEDIRRWLREDPRIEILRADGLWTEQSDRIVEGGVFFRSVEHSAQQPPERLKIYEKKFREGRVNVMSCSTTMEMGVDIGGLSMVVNNNVPPHPANYLQRAGRAGRRNESQSLALTICKDNPHDQSVFNNPLWPFTKQLRQPSITLSSPKIVQRHINALVFTYLLNEKVRYSGIDRIRLKCSWFFASEPGKTSVCDHMLEWLNEMISGQLDDKLKKGVKSVIAFSVLEDRSIPQLLTICKEVLVSMQQKWSKEFEDLNTEIASIPKENEKDPYARRLKRELSRISDEHLLTELVARGFLPSYGFPTGIAQFDPYTVEDFKRKMNDTSEEREDNTQRFRAKPSRNLSMAIREYAPGTDIVLDGLVYKSEGLSLNWHIPQGETDVIETQKIRRAWRCQNCGSSGTSSGLFDIVCQTCQEVIQVSYAREFIQPAGFATGFYSRPTNDVSSQHFTPFQDPWVDANGTLKSLPDPETGYFKTNTEGHIFYSSLGENERGYALCLRCGRAESMPSDPDADPSIVFEHDRLRGKIDGERDAKCDGNGKNYSVKRNISLGYEDTTDVFELYLKDLTTNEFLLAEGENKEYNLSLALTLAVSLRQALASCLGINAEELGYAVKQARIEKTTSRVYAICLYDNCGGGAGFVSTAHQYFPRLFEEAKNYLECPANCEGACEHCLIQHDTKKIAYRLNRKAALALLDDDFLKRLSLPDSECILGNGTAYSPDGIHIEIDSQGRKHGGELSIFVGGTPSEWNIAQSTIKKRIIGQLDVFSKISIVLTGQALEELDEDQKTDLFALVSINQKVNIEILTQKIDIGDGGNLLGQLKTPKKTCMTYATKAKEAAEFSDHWGETGDSILVKSLAFPEITKRQVLVKDKLIKRSVSPHSELQITTELNGAVNGFGVTFWNCINKKVPMASQSAIKEVTYTDRYLFNPLTVFLLSLILKELQSQLAAPKDILVKIKTLNGIESRYFGRRTIQSNWLPTEDEDRKIVIEKLLNNTSIKLKIDFTSVRKEVSHARILEITYASGNKVAIRFDQGLGYWSVASSENYPFEKSATDQISWIEAKSKFLSLRNSQEFPTYISISGKA